MNTALENKLFGYWPVLSRIILGVLLWLATVSPSVCAASDMIYPPGKNLYFSDEGKSGLHATSKYDLLYQRTAITVEAWVLESVENENNGHIFAFYHNSGDAFDGYKLRVGKDEGFVWEIGNNNDEYVQAKYNPSSPGGWHHVAGTFDGSQLKLYYDGKLVASNFSVRVGLDSSHTFDIRIGNKFKGIIDEVRVWKKVLTEKEIAENMRYIRLGDEEDLIFYSRFDNRKETTIDSKEVYYFEDLSGVHTIADENLPYYEKTDTTISHSASSSGVNRLPQPAAESMTAPGNALKFDGVDEWVDLGGSIEYEFDYKKTIDVEVQVPFVGTIVVPFLPQVSSYTKEAWIKPSSTTGRMDIVSPESENSGSDTGSSEQHSLYVENGILKAATTKSLGYCDDVNDPTCQNGTKDVVEVIQDTTPLTADTWYHVAVAHDIETGDFKLYKNGQKVAEKNVVFDMDSIELGTLFGVSVYPKNFMEYSMRIGALAQKNYFNGEIDEVRIWNDYRTEQEIQSNMTSSLLGTEENLVAYYTFDHSKGIFLGDYTTEGAYVGLLMNMEDADWVKSGAGITPVGPGPEEGWLYYDKDGNLLSSPTEDQIEKTAVKRTNAVLGVTEYALLIKMDHKEGKGDAAGDTFGNPSPEKGKTWYKAGTSVSCAVNGIVLETNNINLRYVVSGYSASGPPNTSGNPDPHFFSKSVTDFDSANVLQVPAFTMNTWATIEYKWKSQYRVAVSTLPVDAVGHLPYTKVTDGSGQSDINGSGQQWYNSGTTLEFTTNPGCLELEGYKIIEENPASVIQSNTFLRTVDKNYSVVWQYQAPSYTEEAVAGSPIAFRTVPSQYRDALLSQPVTVKNLDDPNEDPGYLYVWEQQESKLIPTVGSKTLYLEFEMDSGACFDRLAVEVNVKWPQSPHYLHIADAKPVLLDPSSVDSLHYMDMKHTTGDAVVSNDNRFSATKTGWTSLLFSGTHIPNPAMREISLWFDGNDDYVNCGKILPNSYTIQAWINIDDDTGQYVIAGGKSNHLFYVSGGTLQASHLNSSQNWDTIAAFQPITPGQWTHVAVTYDDSSKNLTLYRNGSFAAQTNTESASVDPSLFLGASNENSFHFKGRMDEVAVWDYARSNPGGGALSGTENGLIAYYQMDRAGEGYLHDSSSRRYHAPMENMAPHKDRTHLEFHRSRQNYVELPGMYSGGDLTVEGWVLLEYTHSDAVFLEFKDSSDQNPVYLTLSDGTTGKPEFGTTSSSSIVSGKAIPNNTWTHVAATYSNGFARIFINGVETKSGNVSFPASGIRSNSYMGGNPAGKSCEAIFDKVRIWDVARTQQQISESMRGPLTGSEDNLVALYRSSDSVVGTLLKDSSDSGYDAILRNWKYPSSWIVETEALAPAAEGNEGTEVPIVRIVETKKWSESVFYNNTNAIVGQELISILHDPDAAPPQIFYSKSRYNVDIYAKSGQIFPVNRQFTADDLEDNLLILWQRTRDGISWPENPMQYICKYPTDSKRIVIASRFGSESVDASGNDPDYPDGSGQFQAFLDPARYSDIAVYYQNDPALAGYNPNEEHALIAPSLRFFDRAPRPNAAFALCNDLNVISQDGTYTSDPLVLVQYYDQIMGRYDMETFKIEIQDPNVGYTFEYDMGAGQLLVAPYPVNEVIGAAALIPEIIGMQGGLKRSYWEDHKGQAWAISGDSWFTAVFWYPLHPSFYYNRDANGDGNIETTGEFIPFLWDGKTTKTFDQLDGDGWKGLPTSYAPYEDTESDPAVTVTPKYPMPVQVKFNTTWPAQTPVLKAGETVTFAGGEYRADNPSVDGLPMTLGWAAGQVVYDDLNPAMNVSATFTNYLVRLAQVLEKRTVSLSALPTDMDPSTGRVRFENGMYYFTGLHAGLQKRIFFDPLLKELGMRGFVNDKTLGDSTLTASPPSLYILQPNIMTAEERDTIKNLEGADTAFKTAVDNLYALTRDPEKFPADNDYTVGLDYYKDQKGQEHDNLASPIMALGPGLALMPNGNLLDPDDTTFSSFDEGYVTIAENNHPDMGALPVALHIIKVVDDKYRGAIKRVLPDNAFDEKITLRHTADFGADPVNLYFEWWYHEDEGIKYPPPYVGTENPPDHWKLFPSAGPGAIEVVLAGAGKDLLVDNFFFSRYRHVDCDPSSDDDNDPEDGPACWSDWAGAANSRPPDLTANPPEDPADTFQPQLAEGWIKRVMMAVNPFEARVNDFFNSDSPATYTSMIQQAGPRYEGAVAFNPDKDVIENVGLIELYQTVLNRGKALSIDLSQPASTSGVTAALQLAASRIAGFYALLGNEAYTDSLDPTIGFDTSSGEYGSLAPTIFTFMNQVPTLLSEELALLRGMDQEGARPGYNRLLWNFTNDQGEVAYALSYNITDVTTDGFINEADGRTLYPQAHGDAWGHYLTALQVYYDLLRHPAFNWESRTESFNIEGVVVDVDYLDERKFAEIAAAKAKVGAEVLDLTYRSHYTEDPDGQWQGYRDTNSQRAWGVEEWAQRAFQGAYFDYVTASAMLPSEDTQHEGLKKIDRITVVELQEIAGQARRIQKKYDDANAGLNPLGLSTSSVPFDISPDRLDPFQTHFATHFEQVYERVEDAVDNALAIFDHASDIKNRIRRTAASTQEFKDQVIEQDRDYRNRLIAVFGTPYEGTIGTGKTYPPGYKGPDYFYYNYIDVNEVSEDTVPEPSETFQAFFAPIDKSYKEPADSSEVGDGDLAPLFSQFFETDLKQGDYTALPSPDILTINYPVTTASDYSFQAPSGWKLRKSPGQIQEALIEMVKAESDFKLALFNYQGLLDQIDASIEMLQAIDDINRDQIEIRDNELDRQTDLGAAIVSLRSTAAGLDLAVDEIRWHAQAIKEGLPKAVGTSSDPSFVGRAAALITAGAVGNVLKGSAWALNVAADGMALERELSSLRTEIEIVKTEQKKEIQQWLFEIEDLLRSEVGLRLEIFKARENLRQMGEKYRTVLAEGLRLLEERKAFNARVAAKTQGQRYRDMAFRVSLNEALSMYRQAFDVAARYLYLAAKAYDYETNLRSDDPASAIPLMTKIMRQRTLGQFKDGEVVMGQGGLADIMGRMTANFLTLKGEMGLNNPQQETGRFSLRYEFFRIKHDDQYDTDWRRVLQERKVDDLWKIPEFKKFCRPFAPESQGAQPGVVIAFQSDVTSGYNFFGRQLGGGDHSYDSSNFATKVRSIGVWFDGYDNSLLAETPRVYVVPVGMDVMYVPDSEEFDTREWSIVDQVLPVPVPADNSDLNNPDYIPSLDSLNGSMTQLRRFSRVLAYHDAGYFDDSQMNYNSRAIGRSVWNTRWLIIIPGATFHYDADYGLKIFIDTVQDIKLFFETYAISGA